MGHQHHFTSAGGGRALTLRLTIPLAKSRQVWRQLFQPRESIGIVSFSGGLGRIRTGDLLICLEITQYALSSFVMYNFQPRKYPFFVR